jgi:hypothetical protein
VLLYNYVEAWSIHVVLCKNVALGTIKTCASQKSRIRFFIVFIIRTQTCPTRFQHYTLLHTLNPTKKKATILTFNVTLDRYFINLRRFHNKLQLYSSQSATKLHYCALKCKNHKRPLCNVNFQRRVISIFEQYRVDCTKNWNG